MMVNNSYRFVNSGYSGLDCGYIVASSAANNFFIIVVGLGFNLGKPFSFGFGFNLGFNLGFSGRFVVLMLPVHCCCGGIVSFNEIPFFLAILRDLVLIVYPIFKQLTFNSISSYSFEGPSFFC